MTIKDQLIKEAQRQLKHFGVDINILCLGSLDACIKAVENGKSVEVAASVLVDYTLFSDDL